MKKEILKSDIIVPVSTMFIALMALFTSVWQGAETRENYRLSVLPNITIIKNLEVHSDEIGVYFENAGIGPAVIRKITITFENVNYHMDNKKNMKTLLSKLRIRSFADWTTFTDNTFIKIGEMDYLFKSKNTLARRLALERAIDMISVNIEYESVYEEKFSSKSFW